MPKIPTPTEVTAAWITEQLNRHGVTGTVASFEQQRVGTGQIGMCFRYDLTYEGESNGPGSLIGKFPSDDPSSRATGVQLKNFLKEVRFYEQLQSQVKINTPRCYYAEIIDEGPDFMLLLEDLAPGVQGDQLNGCDETVAEAAVLQLVGLHGPSWCDQSLTKYESWLGVPDPTAATMVSALYQGVLPGFFGRYGDSLSQEQQNLIRDFGTSTAIQQHTLTEPFCLIHIDYRLDNLLIDQTQSPTRITAVDWQSITLGNPMTDVAYFIGAGMLPEARRKCEHSLVSRYHETLVESGISGYDFEQCWADYRRATFAGFAVTVVASMLVQQTERGDEMFRAMATRHSQHALDLNAAEFL